jgi:DNA repair exonuclease SbcCD ATPase subunit
MSNTLEFGKLGFRNFLSYGSEEVVISLLGDYITCILGENLDTGGEDSRNGVGKSAIIDAICYVLFGKVIRGISNQKLINKLNAKGQMIVWLEFTKDEFAYRIERTERPGKLLLLRKPVDNTEDFKTKDKRKMKFDIARGKTETTAQIVEILGFDITLFEYLVANSSESVEFFKLGEDKQRAVIEPLFGFTIMSTKADLLKGDRKERNKELAHAESTAEATKQANARIESQITDLKSRSRAWEITRAATIKELRDGIALLEAVDVDSEITVLKELDNLQASLKDVQARAHALEVEQRERNGILKAHRLEAENSVANITKHTETLAALDKSECPTCKQHWESDPTVREMATELLEDAEVVGATALKGFETVEGEIAAAQVVLDEERNNQTTLDDAFTELQTVNLTYRSVEEAASAGTELDGVRNQLISTNAETNPHSESIIGLQESAIKEVNDGDVQELRRLIRHYTYLIELLTKRDSFLRQLIIDRWLPILNQRIAYWLEILELPHQVRFNPDLTITITNYSEEFDYGNLSKGQRARLRVALNFAFQDVFEFMNYPINMLAVDELLDSGICPRGAENAVTALREICQKKGKRVFLITHRDDIAARVDDVMKVILENNQSRIEHDPISRI